MAADSLLGNVKEKVELVRAHAPGVLQSGVETLRAAQQVVAGAGREAGEMLDRTKDQLKQTLRDGASRIGQKLANIATPTRKEVAEARKEEVKAKKRSKRARARRDEPGAEAEGSPTLQ